MELEKKHLRAARLLAEGWHSLSKIAKRVGVTRKTITNWQHDADFAAQVDKYRDDFRKQVRREGIASVDNRSKLLDRIAKDLLRVKQERGQELKHIAGGATGLLVRRYKSIGSGEFAEKVEEYELDSALLKELREYMTQAARELGQLDKANETDGQSERVVKVRPVKRKNAPDA